MARSTKRRLFSVDRVPPHVHIVIGSRADPPLQLARRRARGELVEIRTADLRFTPDEAAAYFKNVMAVDLTAGELAVLEGRTEGWIAALLAGVLGNARLLTWRGPWCPRGIAASATAAPTRGLCLEWGRGNGQQVAGGYVLVADTGGLRPHALRSQLARLTHRQKAGH